MVESALRSTSGVFGNLFEEDQAPARLHSEVASSLELTFCVLDGLPSVQFFPFLRGRI